MTPILSVTPATGETKSLPCQEPGADPDIWFPEPGMRRETLTAKRLCMQCPGRAACLAGALARNEEFGIFGGLTPAERLKLPRTRPCQTCSAPIPAGRHQYCSEPCRTAGRHARQQAYGQRVRWSA